MDRKAIGSAEKPTGLYRATGWLTGWLVYGLFLNKIIKGKNTLPEEGACIVAANHIHLADPVFIRFAQKRPIHYMAKAELFDQPVTRWLCESYGAFPVVRGAGDGVAINKAEEILRDGKVLGIFPEGTRSKDGKLGRGKSGTVYIAWQTHTPIYPCALYCKRKPLRPFCKYTIAFGEPVTAEDLGITEGTHTELREATRKLMQIIADLQKECKQARA